MTKLAQRVGDAVLPALSRWDPERAHDWGLCGFAVLGTASGGPAVSPPALAVHRLGLAFAHPLGLAAGFDKNGDYLDALGALGFSHVELGTVTPRPQSGNPKPRMFRAPAVGGLVNRMGFNNKGVDHLVARLRRARYAGIRGVSIGKNADTPLEQAPQDYLACLEKVYRFRRLRGRQRLLAQHRAAARAASTRRPLEHRRTAPRVTRATRDAPRTPRPAARQDRAGSGLLADQRDGGEPALARRRRRDRNEHDHRSVRRWVRTGRPTGAAASRASPLHARSVAVIRQLRAELGGGFPIIGVGGIVDGERAAATLQAGADLLQIYTGFAYRGPALLEEILNAIQGH